ncbi:MacB family efflux pump subunit [Pseudaeromonas paramecii]|uniref:Macrolide ABC transporter ATP-binding protein/permease MacB n=1 Tax=Pseudaeromonas paramecii TaxID=2138166 RepID=A0ABP8Q2B2_9GAMM
MSEPLIALSGVGRRFGEPEAQVQVLQDVDLTIAQGEMVAIMGASGSGKSTLMNLLGCLDRPSEGQYRIAGVATGSLAPDQLAALRRDHFGFIFQRYHLLPHLSALENVAIPAVYAGKPKAVREARAAELLSRLGLADRTGHKPSQLSGGQQQRVSIARALMNGGNVILADEPTGALDSRSGQEVMAILQELNVQGHTIILVTHDAAVAAYARRIIEISDGRITADRVNEHLRQDLALTRDQTTSLDTTGAREGWRSGWGRFVEAAKMAGIAMATHRLRTLLTMLGIIIGIMAVVSVVALGRGASQSVIDNISRMGTNTIGIYPGKDWGDTRAARVETLSPGDLRALQGQIYVDSATPSISSTQVLRYGNLTANASVSGVGEQFFRVKGYDFALGRSFDQEHIQHLSQVVVIDDNTRQRLFANDNPMGKVLLLGSLPCRIIGVLAAQDSGFGNTDSLNVWLPYTASMARLEGQRFFSSILIRVKDGMSNAVANQQIVQLLTLRHGTKDVFTNSSDSIMKTVQKTTGTLALLISAIAVISLIVGGIGVMNIMLVSVTERTREIGIRMAVGARQSDILQQFLIEAVLVCLLGGTIGILCSFGVGLLFSLFVSAISMLFSVGSILMAVTCSTLIGVLFGFLPARNAARLDPIEALARE